MDNDSEQKSMHVCKYHIHGHGCLKNNGNVIKYISHFLNAMFVNSATKENEREGTLIVFFWAIYSIS